MKKIKITDALEQVRALLNALTVNGISNAQIIVAIDHDLDEIVKAIKETETGGNKDADTAKSAYRDV